MYDEGKLNKESLISVYSLGSPWLDKTLVPSKYAAIGKHA